MIDGRKAVDVALDGIEPLPHLIAADHAAVAGAGRIDEDEIGEIEPGLGIGHEGRTDAEGLIAGPSSGSRQGPMARRCR